MTRVTGGAATTSLTSAEPGRGSFPGSLLRRLGAALRRQRGANHRLVRVHGGDGRDADARRLDDVDGVDAGARAAAGTGPGRATKDWSGSHGAFVICGTSGCIP